MNSHIYNISNHYDKAIYRYSNKMPENKVMVYIIRELYINQ